MRTSIIEYLKDNPNHYWFKRKIYGWGWIPATWEGWLAMLVFIVLMVANVYRIGAQTHPVTGVLLSLLPQTLLLIALLVGVCYWKGEKPKWQWGLPKNDKEAI